MCLCMWREEGRGGECRGEEGREGKAGKGGDGGVCLPNGSNLTYNYN